MAAEQNQSSEIDLDRTDRLPILEGISFDDDVEDDAVRMDFSANLPTSPTVSGAGEFIRGATIDLPSLAESVRSVEDRIARQNAEFEVLNRSYARARDAESAATLRASALERDLAGARAALEAEQLRSREHAKTLAERNDLAESVRTRAEEAALDRERYQTEARTLRDSLTARDATIVQALHALGERDAQLAALQNDHAEVQSTLEVRSKASGQLESSLSSTRADAASLELQLKAAREQQVAIDARVRRAESDLNSVRSELGVAKSQAGSYLELLRTREWRSGFDDNLFRDMDARVGAADTGRDALSTERDRLLGEVAHLGGRISAQDANIENLRAEADALKTMSVQQSQELKLAAESASLSSSRLTEVEAERTRLAGELVIREQALAKAQAEASGAAQRITGLLAAAEQRVQSHGEKSAELEARHAAEVAELKRTHLAGLGDMKSEAAAREEEMAVLVAHLQQARRPIEAIEAEAKKLREELVEKTAAFDALTEEVRSLRASLERTRGALEEREFLIRRLEKSESNNANALGRIQTSMERLGSVRLLPNPTSSVPALESDTVGELLRIDGDRQIAHRLSRRTRIGRAPGCEMQIDSSSVSRHHALILAGQREAIIEDLNSTNGVIVNGRKVTRHLLHDGDLITIGEIQFKYASESLQTAVSG